MDKFVKIGLLILLSLAIATSVCASDIDGEDGSSDYVTIHVGTFLSDVPSDIIVKVGNEEKRIDLDEIDKNGITGLRYGSLEGIISVGTSIEIEETDLYNGVEAIVEADKDVYVWITDYDVQEDKLVGTYSGDEYSLTIMGGSLSWDAGNNIQAPISLAVSKTIVVNEVMYEFESINLIGDLPIENLAITGMNVSAGGQVSSDSKSYAIESKNIKSVILWNSDTVDNEFVAFNALETVWISDSKLGENAFSYSKYKANNQNSESTWYITGSLYVGENAFKSGFDPAPLWFMSPTYYSGVFNLNIGSSEADHRMLVNALHTSYSRITLNLEFNTNSILGYSDELKKSINAYVKLGSEVKSIGDYAFSGMKLSSNFESDAKPVHIGKCAFKDTDASFKESSTDDDVEQQWLTESTHIGQSAFEKTNIKSANLKSIVDLGSNAFRNCVNLDYIYIPDSQTLANLDLTGIFKDTGSNGNLVFETELDSFKDYVWIPGLLGKGETISVSNVNWNVIYHDSIAVILGGAAGGDVYIPSTITVSEIDYTVSSIYKGAFQYDSDITSVTVPAGVSIGESAFDGCSNLATATLTGVTSVGSYAFRGTALTNVDLSSCTSLGAGAFSGCESLITITGITSSVPDSAFDGCSNLATATLTGVTSVGSYAFRGTALTNVDLSSCTSLGAGAFSGCNTLSNVILHNVSNIVEKEDVFHGCPITIYSGCTVFDSIGARVFSSATFNIDSLSVKRVGENGLGSITVNTLTIVKDDEGTNVDLKGIKVECVTVPDGFNIPRSLLFNHSELKQVSGIPKSIGNDSFSGCSSLTSIDLSSCTSFGAKAFAGCSSLTSINLQNAVTIGDNAFEGCSGLTGELNLNSVMAIGHKAFSECNFTKVVIPPKEQGDLEKLDLHHDSFDDWAIVESDTCRIGIIQPDGSTKYIYVLGGRIVSADEDIRYISIDSSIEEIGRGAFQNCDALEEVVFEDPLLKRIGNSAFAGCSSLVKIEIPDTVVEIGPSAFDGCKALEEVLFTDESQLKIIGGQAFMSCQNLRSFLIPHLVTSIGTNVFNGCASLEQITIPEGITTIPDGLLLGTKSLRSISLPSSITTIGIKALANSGLESLDMSSLIDLHTIKNAAFSNCVNLYEVSFPESLIIIGEEDGMGTGGVFQGCSALTSMIDGDETLDRGLLKLPKSISTIGSLAFSGTGFSKVWISSDSDDLVIGTSAFRGMGSLMEISVECVGHADIKNEAFAYNTVLQKLKFDCGSVNLGVGAFRYCPTIGTDIKGNCIPLDLDNVRTIESGAFSNCTSISEVILSAGLESIAYDAFSGCIMLEEFKLDASNDKYSVENGFLLDKNGTRIAVSPTGAVSVTVPAGVVEFMTGDAGDVFTLMRDLEEILVDEKNPKYVSIDGWLAEKPSAEEESYVVAAVPFGVRNQSISTEFNLEIPANVLNGASVKTIIIECADLVMDGDSLNSESLRKVYVFSSGGVQVNATGPEKLSVLEVEAKGDVTISGSIIATDVSFISETDKINVSGTIGGTKTVYIESGLKAEDTSKGITLPNEYFSGCAGTLSDISLITKGTIDGGTTLIGTGYVIQGGCVTLGFNTITGAVASLSGVTYYIEDGKGINGIQDSKKFIVDDEYRVIRQVDVRNQTGEFYVSSDIDGIGLNVESSDSEQNKIGFEFTTSDGHKAWDLIVKFRDDGGEWKDATSDGNIFYTSDSSVGSNSTEIIEYIFRVDAKEAGMDDEYVRVTFDTGSSISVPYMMVVEGRSILKSQLPDPVRAGYSFLGWQIKDDNGNKVDYAQDAISGDTTLYAGWKPLNQYVDLVGNGGHFTDLEGNPVGSGYLVANETDSKVVKGQKYYFVMDAGYEFIGFDVVSTVSIGWDDGIEDGRPWIIIHDVDGYATVTPVVKFYSLSSDLQEVIGVSTVAPDEDLIQSWAFANNPVMSGMSWHNTPGTPLIVNDHVYLHLGPAVYKLDIETGKEVARADSIETGNFYNYLGYGGSGDSWYILDYATGNVLDEDLEPVKASDGKTNVTLPKGMMYAKWYDGAFYTVFEGDIWKMDPTHTNPEGVMVNGFTPSSDSAVMEGSIAPGDIFSQYGTTSSALIEKAGGGNPTMYWLNSVDKHRYVYAADLVTGEVSNVELSGMYGYFMDDGWLTYHDGYIYTTGYTQGLFGDKGADGNSKIVYFKAEGTVLGDPASVDIPGNRNSLLSGFVIVDGLDRGYVNATKGVTDGGDLLVYNIDSSTHEPVFETSVKSDSSHGGIVVSTANLKIENGEPTGYVNIYMMNYRGSNLLYVFTDRAVTGADGEKAMAIDGTAETKELPVGFGSQAIRVDPEGRIVFYNDSGALYCYVPAHLYSDYRFLIETDEGFEVAVGEGDDPEPYVAMEDAVRDAKKYRATYNEEDNTMMYANVLRYAYYYDGEMFRPLNECPDPDSLRNVFLLKEGDHTMVDPDQLVYTTESIDSGKALSGFPILIGGDEATRTVMEVGQKVSMSVSGDASWASSDSSVVRVDSDGNVTAVSLGSALVVASKVVDGKVITTSCMVSVTSVKLGTLAESLVSYDSTGMFKSPMHVLSFDLDGGEITDEDTTSTRSYEAGTKVVLPGFDADENSLTIEKGDYTFKGWWDGSTIHDAGSDYVVSGTVSMKAYWIDGKQSEVTSIVIMDGDKTEYNGKDVTLSVSDGPLELSATTSPLSADSTVQWSSSDTSVVKVENGRVTAVSPGTATITVSALHGDAKAEFTVTVPGYKVVISDASGSLKVGGTMELHAEYVDGKPLMGAIEWSSSNPAVAMVDSDGKVTAVSAGSAVITATAPNGNKAQCVVTVSSPQVKISGQSVLYVGDSSKLTVTADGIDGFSWSSSNPSSATVDQNGRVTAVAEGYAVITATATDGSGASASMTVTVKPVEAESVEIDRSSVTLSVGGTQALKATVEPSDAANRTVVWSSSNPQVASVSSAGVVTAIAPGTATITATTVDGGHSDSCKVTVQGQVDTITLDKTVVSLKVSGTTKISAETAPYGDAKVTWRSSDSKVASVGTDGTVRGVSPGTATITATCGSVTVKCTVTVYGDSEVVDKGTVDNDDGTKTSTTEETIDAGDSTVVKTTETRTDADGNVLGTEVTITAKTDGSGTETKVTVSTAADGSSSAEATTTVPAKVTTSNGRQTVTVSPADIMAAAGQISSISSSTGQDVIPTVVIDTGSSGSDAMSSVVKLEGDAMSALAANPGTQVRVDTGAGSILMSGSIVSQMSSKGGDVSLSMSQVFDGDLTGAQKAAAAGATVFSLSATAGSEDIHQLGGTATVRLPHALDGGRAEDIRVYYMDDSGELVGHACSYDSESGEVEFQTTHFSYYVVSNGALLEEGSGSSDDDGIATVLTAIAALLAVLVAMIGVGMYMSFVRGRN